jgi:hypothetical protein
MWTQITQPWGLMRIARMFIGVYAFVEAYKTSDTLIAMMGLGYILAGMLKPKRNQAD